MEENNVVCIFSRFCHKYMIIDYMQEEFMKKKEKKKKIIRKIVY